jgi:hypothetical protein
LKKHWFLLVLIAAFFLSIPVQAAEESASNFVRIHTYSDQFSDLDQGSTFYSNVSALYEYGLSVGKGDGSYGVKDPLTVGQAVIFAARIRSIYRTGDPEQGPAAYWQEGQPTAERYLRYLQAEEVLDAALDQQLFSAATRAQMAHILANILPESVLPPIHEDFIEKSISVHCASPDVTEKTPYYEDILSLYSKGICIGSDQIGSFHPNELISRGAVAAMLTRMIDSELRVSPSWPITAQNMTLADLVVPGEYLQAPITASEMDHSLRYMLSRGENTLQLRYPSELSVAAVRDRMLLALELVKQHCEQSYNEVFASFDPQGSLVFQFTAAGIAPESIAFYRNTALEKAISVHDRLWADGTITPGMSDFEKARIYYTWICENCEYDQDADDQSISHIPYSLFEYGTSVCDGYTGAYNLFLRLEGIPCTAISNESHIWTVATLDDQLYHIDTTWGDSSEEINYDYFAMSEQQSRQYHPW